MDQLPHSIRRFLADEPYRRLSPDELWARFRDHKEDGAFHVLLERLGRRIYQRCRAVLGSDPLAEDAFQDAFIELVRHREKLPTYGAAATWLSQTAVNKARMIRRRRWRAWWRERWSANSGSSPSESADVLSHRELQEVVANALVQLPERERRALELVYQDGMTHAEAAAALGWNRGSVGTYVQRGLDRLRRVLERRGVAALMGVVAIEAALRSEPPGLPAVELDAVAARALAAGTAPAAAGLSLKVAAALTLGVGAVVAGLVVALAPAKPAPKAPSAAAPPAAPESVPTRNLRVFREEVAPRLVEALAGVTIGGGDATLESVEAFDTRVDCTFLLVHKLPSAPGWWSRVRLIHDVDMRRTIHRFDLYGDGKYRPIEPHRPIILWRDPLFQTEVVMKVAVTDQVAAAFARLPKDDQSAAEAAEYRERLREAVAPYLGVWYDQGKADQRRVVGWDDTGPTFGDGTKVWSGGYWELALGADGRPQGLMLFGGRAEFSADGKRIDFPAVDNWWSREPIPGAR
jgi:RNA polymerase sigma factor (sigma-70 family)